VYSLFDSIDSAIKDAEKLDAELANKLRQRYECFEPFDRDEQVRSDTS